MTTKAEQLEQWSRVRTLVLEALQEHERRLQRRGERYLSGGRKVRRTDRPLTPDQERAMLADLIASKFVQRGGV